MRPAVHLPTHRVSVALVHPQIAPNTGNVGRLCVATGTELHLVRPLGFVLDDRNLRRAGMDYWPRLAVTVHDDLAAFERGAAGGRLWLFTSRADRHLWDCRFADGDCLVFGSESAGLPADLLGRHPGRHVRIPQAAGERCLNLSTAAGIGLYECLRQLRAGTDFRGSERPGPPRTVRPMPRVLVVDDHVANCQPLVKLFRFSGMTATCADSGPAALAAMGVEVPDLVLLDLMMPDMDGFQVLQAIRADARFASVAVLMYTAVADPDVQAKALGAGAQGFVLKGTGFDRLRDTVRQHLPAT